MKQEEFDRMLMEEVGQLPPGPSDVAEYTPWQSAVLKILWGMGLTTFKAEFFYLQYLLPLLGAVLLYLGCRSLRRSNRWFRLCWAMSGILLAWHALCDILAATPLMQAVAQSPADLPLSALAAAVNLILLVSLRAGIRTAFASTGGEKPKDWLGRGLIAYLASLAIAIWSELLPCTEPSLIGMAITNQWVYYGRGIAFIVLQIYLLVCIARQSEALAGRGYDIVPVPVKVPGRTLALLVFGGVLLSLLPAMYLGAHIPTGPAEPVPEVSGEAAAVRARLTALGMPEALAGCLDEAELDRCARAQGVYVPNWVGYPGEDGNYSVMEASDVRLSLSDGQAELYACAVVLPNRQLRVYGYFRYLELPSLRLQEQLSADPSGNYPSSDYSGRLLWEQDGLTQSVSPVIRLSGGQTAEELPEWSAWIHQYELERLGHYHYSPWFNFSIPKGAENLRGYLAYTSDISSFDPNGKDGFSDFHYLFLRHQSGVFRYPFCSISDLGGARRAGDYGTIQSVWANFEYSFFPPP